MTNPTEGRDNRLFRASLKRVGIEPDEPRPKAKDEPWVCSRANNPHLPEQPVSERFPALEVQEVVLSLFDPEAKRVCVAGAFNNWSPEATPLREAGDGNWVVRLTLRSGQYEYGFVVDGQWREDPGASQRASNPYGGFNSVLVVPLSVRTSIL
jgi:1,4-alpha-glucan branching enzyme